MMATEVEKASLICLIDVDALNEACEKIKESISLVRNSLKELVEKIDQFILSANKKIDEQRRSRARWLHKQDEKMRQLLLDRRMTVHRCRNCC